MKRILSTKELEICDTANRRAYFSRRKMYYISFVYFITYRKNIIYIGYTMNPYTRYLNHRSALSKKGIIAFTISFIGPFSLSLAEKIESYEISIRANSKYLLNKSSKKQVYGKEFSIENFKQKGISYIRKGGKVKTVLC